MTLSTFILGSLGFCVVTIMLAWSWEALRAQRVAKRRARRPGDRAHDDWAWWEMVDAHTEPATGTSLRSFATPSRTGSPSDAFAP